MKPFSSLSFFYVVPGAHWPGCCLMRGSMMQDAQLQGLIRGQVSEASISDRPVDPDLSLRPRATSRTCQCRTVEEATGVIMVYRDFFH